MFVEGALRGQAIACVSMTQLPDVPLFPLSLVMLPGELVPLHIFEPRYRDMIAFCVEHEAPFCLVLADDDGMREVGCLTRTIEVLERLPDGRVNLVATGGQVARIERIDDGRHTYLSAAVTVLDDDPTARSTPPAMDAAIELYRSLLRDADAPADDGVAAGDQLSYELASRVEFPLEVKQSLLEGRAESDRLDRVVAALEEGRRVLRQSAERSRRAQTNGKVSHDD